MPHNSLSYCKQEESILEKRMIKMDSSFMKYGLIFIKKFDHFLRMLL